MSCYSYFWITTEIVLLGDLDLYIHKSDNLKYFFDYLWQVFFHFLLSLDRLIDVSLNQLCECLHSHTDKHCNTGKRRGDTFHSLLSELPLLRYLLLKQQIVILLYTLISFHDPLCCIVLFWSRHFEIQFKSSFYLNSNFIYKLLMNQGNNITYFWVLIYGL